MHTILLYADLYDFVVKNHSHDSDAHSLQNLFFDIVWNHSFLGLFSTLPPGAAPDNTNRNGKKYDRIWRRQLEIPGFGLAENAPGGFVAHPTRKT